MVKVQGSVEYDGDVLHNGTITFNPKDPKIGNVAQSPIADDGSFVLSTFKPGDGAVVGDYIVTIVSTVEGSEVLEKDKGLGIGGKSAIPEHYGDPKTSGLTETIEAGDPKTALEFKLKAK